MGKCIKCGTQFVGTAANPPSDGLCKYCEIEQLKSENEQLRKLCDELAEMIKDVSEVLIEAGGDSKTFGEKLMLTTPIANYSTLPHVKQAKGK
jgi:hypothetical protein